MQLMSCLSNLIPDYPVYLRSYKMISIKNFSPAVIAIFSLIFALSGLTYGKSKNEKFPNVKIKNFGQMDERFFRGERPDDGDHAALSALGVKTIIDLTDNSKEYEQPAV